MNGDSLELLRRFEPVLRFTHGERFFPMDVARYVENSSLWVHRPDTGMERLYAETFHSIEEGTILKGKVLAVKQDGVIVDIGYKSEGFVRGEEFTEDELLEHVTALLTRVKVPVAIYVVDALPRNPVGKIDKPGMRRALSATPAH